MQTPIFLEVWNGVVQLATAKSGPSKYARATDYVEGIGAGLESIQNNDVLLAKVRIQERDMRGEKRTFVLMDIATDIEAYDPEKEDTTKLYHAWSDSLAEKLAEIPEDKFPLILKFVRVPTAGGFKVWTFE